MKKVQCYITNKEIDFNKCYKADVLRENIFSFIQKEFPGFNKDCFISLDGLNQIRKKYLASLISEESGELNELEKEVINAITGNQLLSQNIEPEIIEQLTFGDKIADSIASFGGSWKFIGIFFVFLFIWMGINIFILVTKPFDPYPFILLNLILSCIAAIQAPVIMMSQNRQEVKDRIRNEHDYKINLKAELEIKLLHEKIDHLLVHQNKHLLEIQELQTDYLEDIMKQIKDAMKK